MSVTPELASALAKLPDRPGVYLMKDARGDVVYVGKAQSLRNRVRSYWQKQAPGGEIHRIRSVIDRVVDVEVTQTDSVSEALLLEANLIKRYRPRFNVRLKDDKSYPYIKVTLGDEFPRVERTRKLVNDGSRYFGPYASASSVDESMNLVRRLFPFRTCTIDIKDGVRALQRPCLLYHIKRCQGPCIEAISKDDYRADIEQVELFLEGRQETLVKALEARDGRRRRADRVRARGRPARQDPGHRADDGEPEDGRLRPDRARPASAWPARTTRRPSSCSSIRDGKMIGRDVFLLDAAREATDDEVLTSFLEQYYARAASIPREVYVPGRHRRRPRSSRRSSPSGAAARSTSASRSAARSASCSPSPRATRARRSRASRRAGWPTRARRWRRSRSSPRRSACPARRSRIECYDISNFQGSESVGSMVVFEDGKPRSGEYRRFRIKTVQGPNDFASHQEVLRRRFRSVRTGEEGVEEARRWAMPDLVIVDGGKGQVSAAKEVLDELGLHDLPLAGLAKEREELFLPGPRPTRSSCRRRHRRSTSSSACATRRIGSRSPTTATCGRGGASARRSTTCPASARSASASCSRCSARSSACATRRSSRSRRCPASGRRSRPGSRRRSRPDAGSRAR